MRILILLLALPILLLLCALTAYRAPLPAALAGSRDLIAAASSGLLGLGYLAGLLVYLLVSLRRSGRTLDPVLLPRGLSPAWAPPLGRRYTGAREGRAVEVIYRPAFALQPANLDLTVQGPMGQRLALSAGPQRPLLDCRTCPRIKVPGLHGIQVYAGNEPRARAWLAQAPVRAALVRLLASPDAAGVRELYVQPERVWLRARLRGTGSEIAVWVGDALPAMCALSGAGESD